MNYRYATNGTKFGVVLLDEAKHHDMRSLTFLLLITVFSCEKEDCSPQLPDETGIPSCFLDLLSSDNPTEYVQVERWTWSDAEYYYLTAECCDQFNLLYSADCEYICAPDGGITGEGEGECVDIPEEFERTVIWTRPE